MGAAQINQIARGRYPVLASAAAGHSEMFRIWSFSQLSLLEVASRVAFFGIAASVLIIGGVLLINSIAWIDKPFAGFLFNARMVVENNRQSHWTGASLQFPDKILAANGKTLASPEDLFDIIQNISLGDTVRYTVEKKEKTIEINIPTMRFTLNDFVLIFGIPFVSGLIYASIGALVFVMKPDTVVSWGFLLACWFLSLYVMISFDLVSGYSSLIRVYFFVNTFFPAAFLHLSLVFPQKAKLIERRPAVLWLPYIVSAILIVPFQVFYPQSSFLLFAQLVRLYGLVAAIAMFVASVRASLTSSSVIARQRAKVVLFGAVLAFPLPALARYMVFFGDAMSGIRIVGHFLAIPIMIFPASIAFAIAKHNLFDVDVYIKRAVGYVIMTAIVGFGYFTLQTVTTKFVFQPLFGEYADDVFPVAFALLVVFFFDPINRRIQSAVDRIFFRTKVDYKETVRSVSNALASLLNLDQILARVVDTLRREMFIDAVGVFILKPQAAACRNYFDSDDLVGMAKDQREVAVKHNDPLLALVSREKKLVTKYDIAEDPRYAPVKEPCSESFDRVAGSLAVPLIYQGEVTGVLTIGHKKSGHFFTREDIDLLDTLADEAAVAIENARLAEQMKKEETVRTNLSRYLSPQIVDQIVKNDVEVNLGGDKKVVTVLFSDIRNFTTITESRKPDELVQQLNEYFTEMAGIIFEHGGSLDKYIGDAIVAVFGSLIDLENSAQNAAQAALKMMQRLPELNERWLEKYGLKMQFGIGLSTGEVFLGNIGSPERMEFTVIGDTVNVASRFSGLAKPGQILMTRETVRAFGPGLKCNALPATEVKGKISKVAVFELIGIE